MIGFVVFIIALYIFFGLFGGEEAEGAWSGLAKFIFGAAFIGLVYIGFIALGFWFAATH